MTRRILEELQLDKIAAVDRPCQEGAVVCILKRDFSDKERAKLADTGAALPSGGFPIKTTGDLKNAIQAFGRAKDKAATKAHIISRAKSLGASDLIPDGWVSKSETLRLRKRILACRMELLKLSFMQAKA